MENDSSESDSKDIQENAEETKQPTTDTTALEPPALTPRTSRSNNGDRDSTTTKSNNAHGSIEANLRQLQAAATTTTSLPRAGTATTAVQAEEPPTTSSAQNNLRQTEDRIVRKKIASPSVATTKSSSSSSEQQQLEPLPPGRNAIQANLQQAEQRILSSSSSNKTVKKKQSHAAMAAMEPPPAVQERSTTTTQQQQQPLPSGRAAVQENLRQAEKRVLGKQQQQKQQSTPHSSSKATEPMEPLPPARHAVEENLRQAEKRVMGKKLVSPKGVAAVQQQPTSSGETTSTAHATNATSNVESNLRRVEQRVLGKKQVNAKVPVAAAAAAVPMEPPTSPSTTSQSVVEGNLRQIEKRVLGKRQVVSKAGMTPRIASEPTLPKSAANVDSNNLRTTAQRAVGKDRPQGQPTKKPVLPQPSEPTSHHLSNAPAQISPRSPRQISPVVAADMEPPGGTVLSQVAAQARSRRSIGNSSPPSTATASTVRADQKVRVFPPAGLHGESSQRLRETPGEEDYEKTRTAADGGNAAVVSATSPSPSDSTERILDLPSPPLVDDHAVEEDSYMPNDTTEEEALQRAMEASMQDGSRRTRTPAAEAPRSNSVSAIPTASTEIQAFVAEPVGHVPVAIDVEAEERAKLRKIIAIVGGFFCIVVVVVIVAVIVATGGGKGSKGSSAIVPVPTLAPTSLMPTVFPTMSPTSAELGDFLNCLSAQPGVDVDALQSRGPSFQAAAWMVHENGLVNCTDHLQLFALVTFYYSTNGPNWNRCNENDVDCPGTLVHVETNQPVLDCLLDILYPY